MGKKIGIVGLLLLIVAAGGFYGHKYLKEQEAKDKAYAIIKNCTVRTSTVLDYFLIDSKMTFAETFKNIETNLTELDSKALDLKSIDGLPEGFKAEGLAYIGKCQDVMRITNDLFRKRLMYNIAMSNMDDIISEAQRNEYETNEYIIKSRWERFTAAKAEQTKTFNEMIAARDSFKNYVGLFADYLKKASGTLRPEYLIESAQINRLQVMLTPKATNSTNATNSTAGAGS